jgi:hypothetical protein
MCRSIKVLRNTPLEATEGEARAAALQYVRKVSGYRTPSKAHAATFEAAVAEVSQATLKLLGGLGAHFP